jgi:hypothetical protein
MQILKEPHFLAEREGIRTLGPSMSANVMRSAAERLHEIICFFRAAQSSYSAAIGSIRFGSLFRTFPTRALTGQHVISSDGNWGSSPSLSGYAKAPAAPARRTTEIFEAVISDR